MSQLNGRRYTGDARLVELIDRIRAVPFKSAEELRAIADSLNMTLCEPPLDAAVIESYIAARLKDNDDTKTASTFVRIQQITELDGRHGVPLRRFIQHSTRNALFAFELADDTRIHLGPMAKVRNRNHVGDAIAEVTGFWPEKLPPQATFIAFVNDLLSIRELVETGGSDDQVFIDWLASYLEEVVIGSRDNGVNLANPEDRAKVVGAAAFWATTGELYLHLPSFIAHLRRCAITNMPEGHIRTHLSGLNFRLGDDGEELVGIRRHRGQKIARRRFSVSPKDFDPAQPGVRVPPIKDTDPEQRRGHADTADTAERSDTGELTATAPADNPRTHKGRKP